MGKIPEFPAASSNCRGERGAPVLIKWPTMNVLSWLLPWDFSPTVIAFAAASALLYARGSRGRRAGAWRRLGFWTGLALVYAALQTRFDYYAEREFFLHRLQHLVLHHLGPFLIMLSSPGPCLRAGLPLGARVAWRRRAMAVLLNPWVAALLFFGVIYLWLWPSLHFVAMLDWRLYRVMNWSVTVDGLLFWWLILDRRPRPPARLAPGVRILVSLLVALPQILIGAYITFTSRNLYPIYDLCGRAIAGISALQSQRIGGLILWIPSAMMSVVGALVALSHWISLSSRGRLRPRKRLSGR
jgi:putative membrane protein